MCHGQDFTKNSLGDSTNISKEIYLPPVYRKMNHMVGIIRQELFPATGDP